MQETWVQPLGQEDPLEKEMAIHSSALTWSQKVGTSEQLHFTLRCFTLGLSCSGLSGFLGLGWLFPSAFQDVFNYYLLKYFLTVFLFVFFFWDSYDLNVDNLTLSQRSVRLSSFLSILFSFFLSASFISTILSFASFILSSASVILLLVTSRVFDLNYCIIHY